MRILHTGMTKLQAGQKRRLDYCSSAPIFTEALRDAGHVVDHRQAVPGEPLGGYDVALVGIAPPCSMSARTVYPALDILRRAHGEGCRLVLYVDDWRVRDIFNDCRYVGKEPTRLLKTIFNGRPGFGWATEQLDELSVVTNNLLECVWPPTLVPKFAWGDGNVLVDRTDGFKSQEFVFVDPSAYVPMHPVTPAEKRERCWVSGALTENDRWLAKQPLSWPIERYGHKSKGQPRLAEADLVARYGSAWGVVSCPYYHAGSGWWRARFVYAARARAIVLADASEVSCVGQEFLHPGADIELMSDGELTSLAEAQGSVIQGSAWSASRLQEELDRALRLAVGGA
jgi:hypothetical protein